VNSRNSIKGIAITTGTAVAGVAVAAGLNVTGVVGDAATADEFANVAETTNTASAPAHMTLIRTRHTWQKHTKRQIAAHARKARKERVAQAAAAARAARAAASRSSTRTYSGDSRAIARRMMAARYGWGDSQFSCLNSLWNRESGWNVHAANPSGAYGIPQALPGSKMSTTGGDWRDNPATQIAWGLSYVKSSYGSPCSAWSGFQSKGWY
jgi:hypothetical protein